MLILDLGMSHNANLEKLDYGFRKFGLPFRLTSDSRVLDRLHPWHVTTQVWEWLASGLMLEFWAYLTQGMPKHQAGSRQA